MAKQNKESTEPTKRAPKGTGQVAKIAQAYAELIEATFGELPPDLKGLGISKLTALKEYMTSIYNAGYARGKEEK